jgi:hypothetical protein
VIGQFQNERAVVKTETNKSGLINNKGQLIIDTVFKKMEPFIDGLSIVQGMKHHPYANRKKGVKKNYEVGVVDTFGKFVIPYGKFREIKDYNNGNFLAEIPAESWYTIEGYTTQTAIIDKNGNIIITKDKINPGQFWRKREYFPNGIMEPYDE